MDPHDPPAIAVEGHLGALLIAGDGRGHARGRPERDGPVGCNQDLTQTNAQAVAVDARRRECHEDPVAAGSGQVRLELLIARIQERGLGLARDGPVCPQDAEVNGPSRTAIGHQRAPASQVQERGGEAAGNAGKLRAQCERLLQVVRGRKSHKPLVIVLPISHADPACVPDQCEVRGIHALGQPHLLQGAAFRRGPGEPCHPGCDLARQQHDLHVWYADLGRGPDESARGCALVHDAGGLAHGCTVHLELQVLEHGVACRSPCQGDQDHVDARGHEMPRQGERGHRFARHHAGPACNEFAVRPGPDESRRHQSRTQIPVGNRHGKCEVRGHAGPGTGIA